MAKIKSIQPYNGAENKVRRLGLQPLIDEVTLLVKSTPILVNEEIQSNGAAVI